MSTQFRSLAVGDSFDFISPDRIMNSFYLRCVKTAPRKYRDSDGVDHRVGRIAATVYNVIPHETGMVEAHKRGQSYARELDSSAIGAARAALHELYSGAFLAGYYGELRRMTGGAI